MPIWNALHDVIMVEQAPKVHSTDFTEYVFPRFDLNLTSLTKNHPRVDFMHLLLVFCLTRWNYTFLRVSWFKEICMPILLKLSSKQIYIGFFSMLLNIKSPQTNVYFFQVLLDWYICYLKYKLKRKSWSISYTIKKERFMIG